MMGGEAAGNRARMPRARRKRMAEIAAPYRRGRAELERKGTARPLAEIEEAARRGRWAWTTAYAMARGASNPALKGRLQELAAALPGKAWRELNADRDLIWLLQPAVRWADWLTREKGD